MINKKEFTERIRREAVASRPANKGRLNELQFKLYRGFAWIFAALGLIVSILFLFIMETTNQQFQALMRTGLLDTQESPEFQELLGTLEIGWLPAFMQIYDIRWIIIIGIISLSTLLTVIMLLLARRKNNKS